MSEGASRWLPSSGGVGQSKWEEIAVTIRDPGTVTAPLTFLQRSIFWIQNCLSWADLAFLSTFL